MSKKLILFIVCFSGHTVPLSAMFNQTDQKIQITVVSHARNPDAPLVSADPKIITAQDFMQHARCPMTVAIANGGDVPIVISSASCCNADFLSATNAFNDISINASKKAATLFAVHATIAVLTTIYIYKAMGPDLYEIFKKTTLRHAHKRADAAEQKILASGEEVTGWLSLLPISYMGGLYRLLRKRQQLVPLIKRTLPALYKKMVARIAGVEYVDVDTEKLLMSETGHSDTRQPVDSGLQLCSVNRSVTHGISGALTSSIGSTCPNWWDCRDVCSSLLLVRTTGHELYVAQKTK